ncbi:hypothetical protein ABMY20_12600 [Tenacibaculum sp. SSH1-16]|uniref:phage baseplate protein n=1 Tax=Tenacibaculum sp. SSH1-16 TaxID=3136667 RepID=UPI0032C4A060
MNLIDFLQTGGFPLETNTLDFLQQANKSLSAFGAMAGDKTIISGCVASGQTVSDGYIYYNGELLFFKGGTEIDNIVIIEEEEKVEFEDGTLKGVYKNRYATFGFAGDGSSVDWSEFKRFDPLASLTTRIAKLEKRASVFTSGGAMVFWNKPASEIPEGWREVVNWRGRMPVGFSPGEYEFNYLGKIGGEKTHRLTIAEMPRHRFGFENNQAGGDDGNGYLVSGSDYRNQSLSKAFTKYMGNDKPHNNLPPYRVVMFIECIENN